jgi:hypothetical protein
LVHFFGSANNPTEVVTHAAFEAKQGGPLEALRRAAGTGEP